MVKIIDLRIKNPKGIYQELAAALAPYREKPAGSILFVVEGERKKPIIGLRYPGKKVRKREGQRLQIQWANLFDFEVVPYENGKELKTEKFTFENLLRDFENHKRNSKEFWRLIETLYYKNIIPRKTPRLPGINPLLYLRVLKWIWIQEDFNYRFSWEDVKSPMRYVLETRTGSRTTKGAGRGKFFAALILLRKYFTFDEVKKIIPFY